MDNKRWRIFAGIALLVVATSAAALSLGRVRGTALIGRSLDLSVLAGMDAGETMPEASCFAADVFYGDTRIAPSAVSVNAERNNAGELRIRVRSNTIVDEPVVTLFVRVGCTAVVSRRYVLLAEAVSDAEADNAPALRISPPATRDGFAAPMASPRIAFGGATAAAASPGAQATSTRQAERAAQREARKQDRQERAEQRAAKAQQTRADPAVEGSATVVPRKTLKTDSAATSVMRQSAKAATPRLQIDLLDFTSANVNLRGSSELSSIPSADEAVRAQAKALWRTLNASPEEALRDANRIATLDAQVRTAQDTTKRQGQEIAALSTALDDAKKSRYINPFTLILGALALAALAFAAVLWQRSRNGVVNSGTSSGPWWRAHAAKAQPKDEQHLWKHLSDGSDSLLQPLDKSSKGGFSPNASSPGKPFDGRFGAGALDQHRSGLANGDSVSPARSAGKSGDSLDFKPAQSNFKSATAQVPALGSSAGSSRGGSMGRIDNTPPPNTIANSSRTSSNRSSGFGQSDFAPSAMGSGLGALGGLGGGRVVAAEELFDIQEQADFFLSLGQPEQAIEVLKNHITDNVETSALAYMDLFDIYHRTQRKADYAELREEFNRVFNAQVPEFAAYGAQSDGLEDFPQVLKPIQASWGRPHEAQDVIEESIFRQPEQDQTLDMAAYRELMLLYALAKELARPDAAYSMLPISMQTPIVPSLLQNADTDSANIDLGDGLVFSSPTDDLLSPDDRTVSLPHPLLVSKPAKANDDGSLDFDLSDSAALLRDKLPGTKR